MDSLASRYAEALFDLALEGKAVVAFQKEMKDVRTAVVEHPDLLTFLSHYNIANEAKKELITKLFSTHVSQHVYHFIKLLVDKKRITHLVAICEAFNTLANRYRGIEEGIVYSSAALSAVEMGKIQQRIEKERGVTMELINLIDETLIGGFKIVIRDTVYDNSLRNKIDSLRYELLAGKR